MGGARRLGVPRPFGLASGGLGTVSLVKPGARALALVACLVLGAELAKRTLQPTPCAAGRLPRGTCIVLLVA